MAENNSKGREGNAAQPLGQRHGTVSNDAAKRTGKREAKSAGPDGPRAETVGETFKR